MRTYVTQAIVLSSYDYKESDKVFTLLSPEYGKFDVIAKGTKKIKSKLNGHLEVGNLCSVMVAKGRGFDVLANAIAQTSHPDELRGDVVGYAALKAILTLTSQIVVTRVPDEELFELLKNTLGYVQVNSKSQQSGTSLQTSLYIYVMKLLDVLGYRPELTRCTQCQKGIITPHAVLDVRAGGLICNSCIPQKLPDYAQSLSDSTIKLLLLTLEENFENLSNFRFGAQEEKEFCEISRKLLEYQMQRPLVMLDYIV